MTGRGRYFGPANKTCPRDCPRCRLADCSLLSLGGWLRREVPQSKMRPRAASSRPVNLWLVRERSTQFDERNASVAKLSAAMHTLNHHFDFGNRFWVIPHANQIWVLKGLVGDCFSECLLVV